MLLTPATTTAANHVRLLIDENEAALNDRAGQLLDRFGPPVLVEQFIRGRELNVALVEAPELRALPISEVLFIDQDPDYWPIVTYDAKWKPDSRDYQMTPPRYPADVDPALADRLRALASQTFRLLGCRDYARFDFRVCPAGQPYLLNVPRDATARWNPELVSYWERFGDRIGEVHVQ